MMFGYGSNWASWQVALMSVGMIAFWGLIIWAIFALITRTTPGPDHAHPDNQARHTLDQRLAKGEIDTDEYRRLRDLITQNERTPVSSGDQR